MPRGDQSGARLRRSRARTRLSASAVSCFNNPPTSRALTVAWSGIVTTISCPAPVTVIAPRVTWPTMRHFSVGVLIVANRTFTFRVGTQVWSGLSIAHSRCGTCPFSAVPSSLRSALTGTAMTED